ncbi:MAG: PA14 domain-containing protein, partial [Verrucomicrobiota bacterium]
LPHNLVFFLPGTDVVEAANKQMEKPEEALKRDWLPEDARIWLHSKMINPGQKEELTFKAPEKPGIYPFVCTFPGHAMTMQGRLKVLAPGPTLSALQFQFYLGDWKKLPDFKALTPHREGGLPSNQLELKLDDYRNQFGVVYTGKLEAPVQGDYTFSVAGDDGVRIFLDGKKVVEADGIHPASEIHEGKIKLTPGAHDFRLEYFQAAGEAEIYAAWRGPTFSNTTLSKWVHPKAAEGAGKPKKDNTTGMPLVVGEEPVIYRNFIAGAGNRGIAVGYPGGFNLAWSADHFNLALIWRGAFIDAARHWVDRGAGHQAPLGYDVLKPAGESAVPFALLSSPGMAWPKVAGNERAEGYRWRGYRLDAKRFPTFSYQWNGLDVTERFDTEGNATAGNGRLIRTLKLTGKLPEGAMFRAAAGNA